MDTLLTHQLIITINNWERWEEYQLNELFGFGDTERVRDGLTPPKWVQHEPLCQVPRTPGFQANRFNFSLLIITQII